MQTAGVGGTSVILCLGKKTDWLATRLKERNDEIRRLYWHPSFSTLYHWMTLYHYKPGGSIPFAHKFCIYHQMLCGLKPNTAYIVAWAPQVDFVDSKSGSITCLGKLINYNRLSPSSSNGDNSTFIKLMWGVKVVTYVKDLACSMYLTHTDYCSTIILKSSIRRVQTKLTLAILSSFS